LRISLNGGLDTVEASLAQLAQVDAVMIGRMAYHEPYRLHQLDSALAGRAPQPREALLRAYLPYVQVQLDAGVALKHISRHILGLFHAQPGGRAFRQILSEGAPRPGAGIELLEKALAVTRPPLGQAA
jgi:tRNA-dihydrouridine synthase A